MSALNVSITSTSLDAERRAHEPSMEEILASIRRIIADDEALPGVRRDKDRIESRPTIEAAHEPEPASYPAEVADPAGPDDSQSRARVVIPVRLPQPVAPRPSLPPAAPALEPQDLWLRPTLHTEPEHEFVTSDEAEEAQWAHVATAEETDDLSGEIAAGEGSDDDVVDADEIEDVSEAPSQPLVSPDAAASVASHFQALAETMVINEAEVIERYARDILRPMLKQWLDDNLPTLVERLVRAEIERVARGRR